MKSERPTMDWFERITGFREDGYASTRSRLMVEDRALISRVSGDSYGIGQLELVALDELRHRANLSALARRSSTVRCVAADARVLHSAPENAGALFQVASQFNLLEMTSPNVTPEDGVTRYVHDRTQGPACAIAAGAATIYRNYFAPVAGSQGQTATRQIGTLAQMGDELAAMLGRPVHSLWAMRNGYALCTADGLTAVGALLRDASEATRDTLRGKLLIGWHRDVEVTDMAGPERPRVSQAFCSALPVAYTRIAPPVWAAFARLVLEAAYEATLLSAVVQMRCGGSNRVLLTRLGGGAFGNDDRWIDDAMDRSLRCVADAGLDVVLVSYGCIPASMQSVAQRFA